jgi:hypothetical protein
MNKILLAIMMVVILSITAFGGTIRTKDDNIPVFNDRYAFAFVVQAIERGFGAGVEALLVCVNDGKAILLPKGTKIEVVGHEGKICFITVEGTTGYWINWCDLFDR